MCNKGCEGQDLVCCSFLSELSFFRGKAELTCDVGQHMSDATRFGSSWSRCLSMLVNDNSGDPQVHCEARGAVGLLYRATQGT